MFEFDVYLRQPGFARLWPLVREKYVQLGRVGGSVLVRGLSDVEREALAGLLARNFHGQSHVTVRLEHLDAALQATKYEVSLEDWLLHLYPDELLTRREQRFADEESWREFCLRARQNADLPRLSDWLDALENRTGIGTRTFLECYAEFRAEAGLEGRRSVSWETAARALRGLPGEGQRLPIFAARTTGDAHGLDRDCLAGRMFYWGIQVLASASYGREYAEADVSQATENDTMANGLGSGSLNGSIDGSINGSTESHTTDSVETSETVREKYRQVGLRFDEVSSVVWVAGWSGVTVEPVALPLRTITRLLPLSENACSRRIYVMENPSVFEALLDASEQAGYPLPHPLMCTSGQPSLAALRLLDAATSVGMEIHYSGDFDVKGLQIAMGLKERYRHQLQLWRMDCDSYLSGLHPHGPRFTEWEVSQLEKMQLPWDADLAKLMVERGIKVFQEHLVAGLLEDSVG